MILAENDQTLIPLYNKVLPKLNGKFRAAQKFRPFRILVQILTIQFLFWASLLVFQFVFLTLPSVCLKKKGGVNGVAAVLWPNLDFLFDLENYSIKNVLKSLNCLNFLVVGFIRYTTTIALPLSLHLIVALII